MAPPPHSSSSRREPSSTPSPITGTSGAPNTTGCTQPSSSDTTSPTRRLSRDSEGYPTWLPRRPPPPAPASTLGAASHIHFGSTPSPVDVDADVEGLGHTVNADAEAYTDAEANYGYPAYPYDHEHDHELGHDPRGPQPQIGGRKPAPRSVRIVSLQDSFVGAVEKNSKLGGAGNNSREPTDQTLISGVNAPPRVFTRASYPNHNPTAFLPSSAQPMSPYAYAHTNVAPPTQPRFNAKNLNLQILLNPSKWMKLYFYLWPFLVFYHIPLQSFFDFNAVFILVQVSKFPSSTSPSSSRKNWALGAAAYIACWFAWILFVCIMYELVYSFSRRWRLRRPLMLPIFLSSAGFNLAAMTSYTNFSFLQHLRISAFMSPEDAYLASGGGGSPGVHVIPVTEVEEEVHVRRAGDEQHEAERGNGNGNGNGNGEREEEIEIEVDAGLDDEFAGEFGEILEVDEKRRRRPGTTTMARTPKPSASNSASTPSSTQRAKRHRPSYDDSSDDDAPEKKKVAIAWKQGLAETFFFYSQNVPTVALLLPRAALCLALLFAFSASSSTSLNAPSNRDGTFFRSDGSLTDYARGVLIANAAWTGWRVLVLMISWLGLWIFSNQRLGGLCGPRHTWDEYAQEKTRARYSAAASEYEAYRSSFYGFPGSPYGGGGNPYGGAEDRRSDYGGDELAWAWRETTRMRVQDAFEFCITTRRRSGGAVNVNGAGQGLRWSTAAAVRSGQPDDLAKQQQAAERGARLDVPSAVGAKEEGPEGIEKVLAAVGLGGGPSPAKRGALSKDLFSGPPPKMGALVGDREQLEASSSTGKGVFAPVGTELEKPKMAKRNSKDKEISMPYPFSRPGAGQVPSARYPFGIRRPVGAGHGRTMSGVSSALSSGGAGSVITHSTGNQESAESSTPSHIPMPPRHPAAAAHAGRGRSAHVPVAFPSVHRQRMDSGPPTGIVVDPPVSYFDHGSDEPEDEDDHEDDDEEDGHGEHEDSVGLLGIPSSAHNSRISLSNSSSSGDPTRSRTHSRHSVRSRTRTHSSSRGAPSLNGIRERASSLGASMRSLMQEAYSSSGGTHSRSGSESLSVSAENYTFGRPMAFTRPPPPPSPVREQPEMPDTPVLLSTPGVSQSLESQVFYDVEDRTASSTPAAIPIPIHPSTSPTNTMITATSASPPQSSSDDHSNSNSSERQGVSIPWSHPSSHRTYLHPPTPNTLALPSRYAGNAETNATSSSGSPPDISTAAGSFVTAPATLDTDSATLSNASQLTIGADGSWGSSAVRRHRASVAGGPMVDRPADDMGASGPTWHIM
ncbi:hypothetical protein CVT25_005797 [Psilocybe cyanescens]|uniref:Proteophosphoglycan ppg4 n=1 Tax=Psilocybe cyanescens TaxID=93625 RepID=A0A409XA29_PSICY|nr:hypothetical protein CVT25_005797 [Psilocybe cyanescens]